MEKIKVLQFGLGPIGIGTARIILNRQNLELAGACDIDPAKAGKDVGEILGNGTKVNIPVTGSLEEAVSQRKPDIAVHTTSSSFEKIFPQLENLVKNGISIVSSTEELLQPYERNPELTSRLDQLCKKHGVRALGTGVNPGFVMDSLALVLTGVCEEVESIHAVRRVDAGTRRLPLQKKVGAGMTVEEFRKLADQKKIGHVGLVESLYLVAAGLGWKVEKLEETLDPMVAEKDITTQYLTVKKGQVSGIQHIARGTVAGKLRITLELYMYVGEQEPSDTIHIAGTPPIDMVIRNGVAGDIATAAMLVNAIPKVLASPPGFHTMKDIAPPSCA